MEKEILDKIEKTIKIMPSIEVIHLTKKDYKDFCDYLEKENSKIYGKNAAMQNKSGSFI